MMLPSAEEMMRTLITSWSLVGMRLVSIRADRREKFLLIIFCRSQPLRPRIGNLADGGAAEDQRRCMGGTSRARRGRIVGDTGGGGVRKSQVFCTPLCRKVLVSAHHTACFGVARLLSGIVALSSAGPPLYHPPSAAPCREQDPEGISERLP